MTVTFCPPFTLTRTARLEMTSLAVLYAPTPRAVAPMEFSADAQFSLNDHPKTWNLPDSAVALLHRAGEWSARNAQYGFVPADMLARFSSDPVQAAEELLRRGLWRRVRGGYRFAEWELLGETAGQAAQREADADAERTVKSAGGKLGNHERWHAKKGKIAPGCEFCQARPGDSANRTSQVRSDSDSDATPIDRSDQGLSISRKSKSKSKSDARAGEDPALVTAVTDAICSKVGFVPEEGQVCGVIAVYRERARKAGTRIRSELAYFPAAIANEPDLWDGLLLPKAPPMAELREAAPSSHADPPVDPWATPWTSAPDPGRPHGFAPIIGGGVVCRVCNRTENNPLHVAERTA